MRLLPPLRVLPRTPCFGVALVRALLLRELHVLQGTERASIGMPGAEGGSGLSMPSRGVNP